MQTDPDQGFQGNSAGQEGATGTPTPEQAEVAKLKEENATLREERRKDRAKALGAEHGLGPTATELIASLPADQQEEKAKQLAAETKPGTQPTPPADQAPTEPSATEPNAQDQAALDAMASSGQAPPPVDQKAPTGDFTADMQAEIDAVDPQDPEAFNDLKRIQNKYREIAQQQV